MNYDYAVEEIGTALSEGRYSDARELVSQWLRYDGSDAARFNAQVEATVRQLVAKDRLEEAASIVEIWFSSKTARGQDLRQLVADAENAARIVTVDELQRSYAIAEASLLTETDPDEKARLERLLLSKLSFAVELLQQRAVPWERRMRFEVWVTQRRSNRIAAEAERRGINSVTS